MNGDRQWRVLKFGGTSVAGVQQWQTIASITEDRLAEGFRVMLVCSAVAGVTNRLTQLVTSAGMADSAAQRAELLALHRVLADELEVPAEDILAEAEIRLVKNLDRLAGRSALAAHADLLACGEWLSTRIGARYLSGRFETLWLDARQLLTAREEPALSEQRRWLSASCESGPDRDLQFRLAPLANVIITQGFIAGNSAGECVLLGRGGSDTSAALLAGRLEASGLEIWTDVPGLFTTDPRMSESARLLPTLSWDEALEMAAGGAKVVHPECIKASAATGTTLEIRDTGHAAGPYTRIGREAGDLAGVKAINCHADLAVLLLEKNDLRRELGFLAAVFAIFRQQGLSIELVATSETTTTVALRKSANLLDAAGLSSLVEQLQEICSVRLHADCACINLVGREVRKALPALASCFSFFDNLPLLMLSQSANELSISLVFPSGRESDLLETLHSELILSSETERYLGPSWSRLRS